MVVCNLYSWLLLLLRAKKSPNDVQPHGDRFEPKQGKNLYYDDVRNSVLVTGYIAAVCCLQF